jgi:NO-binding membrane sensor protein with MHYT domain
MHFQDSPLVGFDFRLVALSGLALIVATYAALALAERIKASQGRTWFAWLGGGASAMGVEIGIWSMHYFGLKAFDLPVPMLNNPAVPLSILATIFASGITLLLVSGKSDSGDMEKQRASAFASIWLSSGHNLTRKWILPLRGSR